MANNGREIRFGWEKNWEGGGVEIIFFPNNILKSRQQQQPQKKKSQRCHGNSIRRKFLLDTRPLGPPRNWTSFPPDVTVSTEWREFLTHERKWVHRIWGRLPVGRFTHPSEREEGGSAAQPPTLLHPPTPTRYGSRAGTSAGVARCRGSPPREYGGWESTGEPGGDGGVPGTVRGDTKGPGGAFMTCRSGFGALLLPPLLLRRRLPARTNCACTSM